MTGHRTEAIKKRRQRARFLTACLICLISLALVPAVYAGAEQVTLNVEQILTADGLSVPPNQTISYKLTAENPSNPMPDGSGPDGYDFTITGSADYSLGPFSFVKSGIYTYQLACTAGPDADGYVYDRQVYTIEFYVTNDLSPLTIVYITNGDKVSGIVFEHTYTTLPSDPLDMMDPPLQKVVRGNPPADSVFIFLLTAEKQSYPMPEGSKNGVKTLQIIGAGQGSFGTWSYTQEGVYRYTVSEVDTGVEGYIYDSMVYTITDTVTVAGGQLTVNRIIMDARGVEVTVLLFTNTYQPPSKPGKPGGNPGTGDGSRLTLWLVWLTVSAATLLALMVWASGETKKADSKNRVRVNSSTGATGMS